MKTIRVQKPAVLEDIPARQSCVIAASAGTGKTFTLEHLVVDAVLGGTDLDQILVVTFTRRATAEMKGRIRRKFETILEQWNDTASCDETSFDETSPHWRIDATDIEAIQRALDAFDDASISTIHAFCQSILSDFAFASGEFFDAELVDEEQLFEECFHDVLRSTLAVDQPYRPWLEAWLESNDLDDLAGQLRRIYSRKATVAPRPDEHGLLEAAPDDELDSWQLSIACWELFLEPVADEMDRRKSEDGLMTYQDLIETVRDGLDAGLAGLLGERFEVVLVDEFQDTDPVQWEIFREAFLDAGRCLYVIGDEKQAIYSFRGADVGTYRDAIDNGGQKVGFAKTVQLPKNYRSTEELVDAYNAFFAAKFFGGEYQPVQVPANKPVRALPGGGSAMGAEPIELIHLDEPSYTSAGTICAAFIAAMTDRIKALLAPQSAGSYSFSPDGKSPKRPLEPGDIYVLTRTNKEADQVGEALAARGVPHSFYRKPGLFKTDEALHVLRLLRAIARPGDRSRRRKAMLTPFFGIELDDMSQYDLADENAWTPRRQLQTWRQTARRRDFVALFDRIMRDSGVIRRELLASPNGRRMTNYRHIFDWLLEQAAGWRHGVEQLADILQRCRDGNGSQDQEQGSGLQRLETDRSSVQIMTIHKSKGLAAEVVFLCGGFSARPSKSHYAKVRVLAESSEYNDYDETIAFPYLTGAEKKTASDKP
ncbi:MAG: UvrD-helicase domain-containing protein, partial [Persicimonas sp.]